MQIENNILKTDEKIAFLLRSLYHRFGYNHYKMKKFEEYELYARNRDFLSSESIISFTDTTGKLMALKPDVTLSIINNSQDDKNQIKKLYYDENVYRLNKGFSSYSEIRQIGLECIGYLSIYEICEVVGLALKSLENITEYYIFEISHIGLLNSIFEENKIQDGIKNKILNCIRSKSIDEFDMICKNEQIDENIINKLKVFMKNFRSIDEAISELRNICSTEISKKEMDEFNEVLNFIKQMGYNENSKVNFALTNDINYYSGVAFKGYVMGIPSGIISGGQYDNLMEKMGRTSNAIGFAVYLNELKRLGSSKSEYDVDILLLHGGYMAEAVNEVKILSKYGKSVWVSDFIPKNIKYRKLLKMTDKGVIEYESN